MAAARTLRRRRVTLRWPRLDSRRRKERARAECTNEHVTTLTQPGSLPLCFKSCGYALLDDVFEHAGQRSA
jgi:hypothetical protein